MPWSLEGGVYHQEKEAAVHRTAASCQRLSQGSDSRAEQGVIERGHKGKGGPGGGRAEPGVGLVDPVECGMRGWEEPVLDTHSCTVPMAIGRGN